MRVNIYSEEMTHRIEIVEKETADGKFTGLRFYLELPVTVPNDHGGYAVYRGPFMHRPGDDDSSAVTFWGKSDLRTVLKIALAALDQHYGPDHMTTVRPEEPDKARLLSRLTELEADNETMTEELRRVNERLEGVLRDLRPQAE